MFGLEKGHVFTPKILSLTHLTHSNQDFGISREGITVFGKVFPYFLTVKKLHLSCNLNSFSCSAQH